MSQETKNDVQEDKVDIVEKKEDLIAYSKFKGAVTDYKAEKEKRKSLEAELQKYRDLELEKEGDTKKIIESYSTRISEAEGKAEQAEKDLMNYKKVVVEGELKRKVAEAAGGIEKSSYLNFVDISDVTGLDDTNGIQKAAERFRKEHSSLLKPSPKGHAPNLFPTNDQPIEKAPHEMTSSERRKKIVELLPKNMDKPW
ncbi:hypothetical protein [uncultured Mediterranean phage uvMED]|nr:hypothetical protein [uncultured Mediterranean phage uvMED]